jgi:hypothetical protein
LKKGEEIYAMMNERQKEIVDFVFEKLEEKKNGTLTMDVPLLMELENQENLLHLRHCAICSELKELNIRPQAGWELLQLCYLVEELCIRILGYRFNAKNGSSSAKPNNKAGRELIETEVMIIDETSMVPKHALEIIDRKLKELMDNNLPFGGKVIIVGGDFRQVLPIERRAGRNELVNLSVTKSGLWHFSRSSD